MSKPKLTKQQAIDAMMAGKKVRHDYSSQEEWATMENGMIVLEDGVKCTPHEFWRWRTNIGWETGWSIVE